MRRTFKQAYSVLPFLLCAFSSSAYSAGFETWAKTCGDLFAPISANGLDQWGNTGSRHPSADPLLALHAVHYLAGNNPAIAKLEPLLGIGRATAVDTQTYRRQLQGWVDEYAPGWSLVWPEELKAIGAERARAADYQGLAGELVAPVSGFVHPRLHAELMAAKKLPIADPHDLLTHLPDLADAKFRSVMENRSRFMLEWWHSEFVGREFPAGKPKYSDDPTVIAAGKLLKHLSTDVRDSAYENLPFLVGSPGSKKLVWHGNYEESLFAALSNLKTQNSEIANLLLGDATIFPENELPFFKQFKSAQPGVFDRFQKSQMAMGKWGPEGERVRQQLDGIIAELRNSEGQRRGGEPAVDEFLNGLANRLGSGTPLDKVFNLNVRLEYLENSLALYDQYLKWLGDFKNTDQAAHPPWIPRVISWRIVPSSSGDYVEVEHEYNGIRTKMEFERKNRSLSDLGSAWKGSVLGPSLKGKVIVDVGCGDGATVRDLKEDKSGWGVKKVIGIDIALRDSQRTGKDRDLFIEGDALKLPLPDNSVDVYHSWEGAISYYAIDEEPGN